MRKVPARRFLWFFAIAVVTVVVVWQARLVREQLRCWPDSYGENSFLAYCEDQYYADYEHAAYALGLEPRAQDMLRNADVLFLGSSRVLLTFSADAMALFFGRERMTFYNVGFGYAENSSFGRVLWQKIRPSPALLVINVDPYFLNKDTAPTKAIKKDPFAAWANAMRKKLFQSIHEPLCQFMSDCGTLPTLFRRIDDGRGIYNRALPMYREAYPLKWMPYPKPDMEKAKADAKAFLDMVGIKRDCVVFTTIPSDASDPTVAREIADAVGVRFLLPQVRDIRTFDHSHMTFESAERFASVFLEQLRPMLAECVRRPR